MSRATELGLKHPGEVSHQIYDPKVSEPLEDKECLTTANSCFIPNLLEILLYVSDHSQISAFLKVTVLNKNIVELSHC